MTYKSQIVNKINSFTTGKVFITNDFLDIAEYETIRSTLNRLVKDKELIRVVKGVYYKPKYFRLIKDYDAPDINEIANAIARKYSWNIAPSENASLNMLGLDTQVPAKWVYVSDGRSTSFEFEGIVIEFRHRTNRDITKISTLTSVVIQAIKAIGKGNITDKHITHLKAILSSEDKKTILREGVVTSAWVYVIIKKICEMKYT